MAVKTVSYLSLLVTLAASPVFSQTTIDVSGKVSFELNQFHDDGQFDHQNYRTNLSIAGEPEFYWESETGNQSVTFAPFARLDQQDNARTHGDIREFFWLYASSSWEVRAGIGKVFWGVTEFNHLVDIINQTDGVESFDGEDKLGQPMISFSQVTDTGIFDLYVLPGFRERTFPGEDGRFRSALPVKTSDADYEAKEGDDHIDYAVRWSHSFSVFDVGFYGFNGTDRNPQFTVEGNRLVPYYQQITQLGVDMQATIDSWLWKLELISQSNDAKDFTASQLGFEYTLYGIGGTNADLGWLVEYGWDSRGDEAASAAQNDYYTGGRLTFNDTRDSDLLFGFSYDEDYHSQTFLLEASTRLSDQWTLEVQAANFDADDGDDVISFFDHDDRLQITLDRYF